MDCSFPGLQFLIACSMPLTASNQKSGIVWMWKLRKGTCWKDICRFWGCEDCISEAVAWQCVQSPFQHLLTANSKFKSNSCDLHAFMTTGMQSPSAIFLACWQSDLFHCVSRKVCATVASHIHPSQTQPTYLQLVWPETLTIQRVGKVYTYRSLWAPISIFIHFGPATTSHT